MSRSRIDGSWFREEHSDWQGYSISLEVEKVLCEKKSAFQDVLVFKRRASRSASRSFRQQASEDTWLPPFRQTTGPLVHTESDDANKIFAYFFDDDVFGLMTEQTISTTFGNVLVLDGTIQCTERDEASYQEMIAHLPLNCHPSPHKVLVIGGGDGGVIREVLKYRSVNEVVLCEIDETVINVCKDFLPSMSSSLSDPRVTIAVEDGIKYVQEKEGEFDVIITDAPDPFGAAEGLYERQFYSALKKALKPNGIICCQGETIWFDLNTIKSMLTYCNEIFPSVGYASGNTPTYTGGQMGYMLCSTNPTIDFTNPVRDFSDEELEDMSMKYYTPDLHRAAFKVLPRFVRKELQGLLKQ